MVVHYANNNFKIRVVSCGERKDGVEYSVDVPKVNCITCIEKLLKRQNFPSRKTPLWENRLRELKEVRECTRYFEQQKLI